MVDAAPWANLYLMFGGAAAVLTGLVFVALSLQTRAIIANRLYRDRAFATIQSLMSQVFLAAVVLVPSQPAVLLAVEVGLVALYWIARSIWAKRLIHEEEALARGRARRVWLVEWAAWLAWLAVLSASAVAFALEAPIGFGLLALAMLYMFGSNVWNAWVLIVELAQS